MDTRLLIVCLLACVAICSCFQISHKIRVNSKRGMGTRRRPRVLFSSSVPKRKHVMLRPRPVPRTSISHNLSIKNVPASGIKIIKHTVIVKPSAQRGAMSRRRTSRRQPHSGHGGRVGHGNRGQRRNIGGIMMRSYHQPLGRQSYSSSPNNINKKSVGHVQLNVGGHAIPMVQKPGYTGPAVHQLQHVTGGHGVSLTLVDQNGIPQLSLPVIKLHPNGTAMTLFSQLLTSNPSVINKQKSAHPSVTSGTTGVTKAQTTLAPGEDPPETTGVEQSEGAGEA